MRIKATELAVGQVVGGMTVTRVEVQPRLVHVEFDYSWVQKMPPGTDVEVVE